MHFVKHRQSIQIKEDTSFDLEGVLSYNFMLVGDTPVNIGGKRLVYQEDAICVDSDGIAFGAGNSLEITFDEQITTRQVNVEFIKVECCDKN